MHDRTGLRAARTALDHELATLPPGTALAVAQFVDWYRGHTASAYCQDMKTFIRWCAHPDGGAGTDPLAVTRLQLEQYARHLIDGRGNAHKTMRRRMQTIARFYNLAAADGRIPASPATHVRTPSRYASTDPTRPYLGRHDLAKLTAHARTGTPAEAALVTLLGILGLRISEAIGLQIADYQHVADGHRVLKFVGKGGKQAVIPIPVPVLRLLDQAAGGRTDGPLLVRCNGTEYNYRAALRAVTRLAADAGIEKRITPHALRRSFATAALDAGLSMRDAQTTGRWADPRMLMLYDQGRHELDRNGVYTIATFIAGAA